MSDDNMSDDMEDIQRQFNEFIIKGKKLVEDGKIKEALETNKAALQLCFNEKLAKKIKKMEDYLAQDEEDEDDGMIHLGKGFYIFQDLYKSLYVHQQEGVLWLWSLYRRKKGGILADDMGLGKTIQVISFLSGMFDMQKIRYVLIVLPVAVMVNWGNEFTKWAPGLKVVAYHGNSKVEKRRALARVQKRGGVCLTTYGLVVTSWETLGQQDGREFVWDYMILDEGHKIKNPTKTSKGVHAIPANNRIILTGTPVQNNLKELWSLYDFVHQGTLLGNQKTFKMAYENPITRAREKDATIGEKKLGMEMAESLKKIIEPYFLRRTKAEVNAKEKQEKEEPTEQSDSHAVMPEMTRKNDLIVWTYLRDTQLKIYGDFLSLDSVKELLMTTKSPLVALTVLKKICDHPRLLSTRACSQLGIKHDDGLDEDILETEEGSLPAVSRLQHIPNELLIDESGKLQFLVHLLDRLKQEGHRCLVFSQSRKMLDIMQKVITTRGHKVMRLDGTISHVQEREQRIQKFQTDSSYSVFLLTTQVGGVGLTLTAADRVVIFDPSWNPAVDAQAVDRAFRIGQEKNVVVYRLITCGTVEEKIYRRQIFKDSITRQTTGNAKNPHRYFSKYELRELFVLDDPRSSTTQQQLEQMHSGQRLTDPSLDEHIAYLYSLEMFGLSDHDLMFSHGNEAGDDQDKDGEDPENDYILSRVQRAKEIIQMESSQPLTREERLGKNTQVGTGGGRALYNNWDFPKNEVYPGQNDERDSDSEADEDTGGDISVKSEHSYTSTYSDDVKPTIKHENEYIDLTSPVARKTHEDHHLISAERIKQEPGIKQSSSPYNQQMEIDSPKKERDAKHNDQNAMEMGTPEKSGRRSLSYTTPKSDKNDESVLSEDIIMSPDVSRPLVQSRQGSGSNLNSLSLLNNSDFKPKFNSTVLRPSSRNNAGVGDGTSPALSEQSFFQDSPAENPKNSRPPFYSKVIVEESPVPVNTLSNELDDVSIIEESVLMDDSVVQMEHDLQDILDRSLGHNVSTANVSSNVDSLARIPRTPRRKSTAYHRPVSSEVEKNQSDTSSTSENSVHNAIEIGSDDDEELPDLDHDHDGSSSSKPNSSIGAKPQSGNGGIKVEPVDTGNRSVSESSDLPDLEIEDEHDASSSINTSRHPKTGIDTSRHSIHKSRQSIDISQLSFADGSAGNDDDSGGDDDREVTEMEHDVTAESEEEYTGSDDDDDDDDDEEEEDEVEGFDALSEELQIKYNELVETGRELCAAKRYEEGQVHVLQALEIFPDPELQETCMAIQRKILKAKLKAKET